MGKEKELTNRLVSKYKTSDPFLLCDYLDIHVHFVPLGSTRGVYRYIRRTKIIAINSDLDDCEYSTVCAHELGHALMHTGNAIYMNALMPLSRPRRQENEANRFAANLLIGDCQILELIQYGYNIQQMASEIGVSQELMELRMTDY